MGYQGRTYESRYPATKGSASQAKKPKRAIPRPPIAPPRPTARLIPATLRAKTSSAMTRVLLIRHGETPWNRDRRWQGHADVPLNTAGVAQAARLAAHLKNELAPVAAVSSSELRRASDTARTLARALAAELVVDPAWREIEVGRWTGLSRDE